MREKLKSNSSLAGHLLLAHPALREGIFKRSVILMSADDVGGSLGIIINRPLGRRLDDLSSDFALGPLAAVPVYSGGPVETEKLLLTAWRWSADGDFVMHFGLEPERAAALIAEPGLIVRGFLGYSGWEKGQLETEMKRNTWFVATPADYNLVAEEGSGLWRMILGSLDPELKLLAEEPEDPTVN